MARLMPAAFRGKLRRWGSGEGWTFLVTVPRPGWVGMDRGGADGGQGEGLLDGVTHLLVVDGGVEQLGDRVLTSPGLHVATAGGRTSSSSDPFNWDAESFLGNLDRPGPGDVGLQPRAPMILGRLLSLRSQRWRGCRFRSVSV